MSKLDYPEILSDHRDTCECGNKLPIKRSAFGPKPKWCNECTEERYRTASRDRARRKARAKREATP